MGGSRINLVKKIENNQKKFVFCKLEKRNTNVTKITMEPEGTFRSSKSYDI
jgi:hypothetical protein